MDIQWVDVNGPRMGRAGRQGVTRLKHHCTDKGGVQFQAKTEVRPLLRGFQNLRDIGHLDGEKQVMHGVVLVAALTKKHFFVSLSSDTQGWLKDTVMRLERG
ncbi:hypothetical protein KDH_27710 [Dictyobacter sp. S3.2.2.5]|uniref:Uncharacterized protein n=1 Tax=Dictyobacter halimunensis TaxID=3026934 RepID=A0ABQ6FU24_9CHLR|nr:hypothetical protein KDH_27710 [Dictyobacter sp. S3.2.2.5]